MTRFSCSTIFVAGITGLIYVLYAPAVALEDVQGPPAVTDKAAIISATNNPLDLTKYTASIKVASPSIANRADLTTITMSWSAAGGAGLIGDGNGLTLGGLGGQTVIGSGSSPDAHLGGGFWYGARTCLCQNQGDGNDDNYLDAIDLNFMIDALFFGGANIQDATCPTSRYDVNCTGYADAIDLNYLIDFLFFGGTPPCAPCVDLLAAQ